MYIEITPTNNIVTFRYQTTPDYSSQIIDFTKLKQDLVVTVTYANGAWSADHTYEEIDVALQHGVLVRLIDATFGRYAIVSGKETNKYHFFTADTNGRYHYTVTNADVWSLNQYPWRV